jgi:hypothetical protein
MPSFSRWVHGLPAAQLTARPHGCPAARQHGCTVARLPGRTAARSQGCPVARLHGYCGSAAKARLYDRSARQFSLALPAELHSLFQQPSPRRRPPGRAGSGNPRRAGPGRAGPPPPAAAYPDPAHGLGPAAANSPLWKQPRSPLRCAAHAARPGNSNHAATCDAPGSLRKCDFAFFDVCTALPPSKTALSPLL